SPKPRRFRAVRQMSLVCDSSRALAHLVSHRCRALSEPRRANAFAAHEPGEARSHQGDGQWVVCDLLLEVFEKLAAGCVLCIIDELIDDLSGAHARSQFIESVGKLVAAGFGLSFKLLAVRHSHSSSVVWLRPRRVAAAELFYSASDFSSGAGICR